ncbi:MAG: hypothetical protein AAF581_18020 [Planctomycetota bacterium]
MIYSREFFELQLLFAATVQTTADLSFEQALLDYTNFYVRLGCGRDFDDTHPNWRDFVAGLAKAADKGAWIHRYYRRDAETQTAPDVTLTSGCFSFAVQDSCIRIHFRNVDDRSSPLAVASSSLRLAELTELSRTVRDSVDAALPVVGVSWLYNLQAYRRLFPPGYVESARPLAQRYRSMPLWGQFVDRAGACRPAQVKAFKAALEQRAAQLRACAEPSARANWDECFPLPVLRVTTPVSDFCEHYC